MARFDRKGLESQADAILREAEDAGVASNYFFKTTFSRYLTQLRILDELEKAIDSEGLLVSKEYVKGRKNMYASPAVVQYNSTTDSANRTVTTLLKIVADMKRESESKPKEDPLMKLVNGDVGDGEEDFED